MNVVIDAARIVREYEGVYNRTCEMQRLPDGTGINWDEISLAALTAQDITETTELDNPQQVEDTLLSGEPTMTGIQIRFTDRAKARISKKVAAKTGVLGQNAMNRKKDGTYLTLLDTATTSLCGAGTPWSAGYVGAAVARIQGNATERSVGTIHTVVHPFQLKDAQDEITAGVGTYAIPTGISAEIYRKGFKGTAYDSNMWTDGNITIDGSDDAKGGTHSTEAVVCIQGRRPRTARVRQEHIGGGAVDIFMYDDYTFIERQAGQWMFEQYSDALAPTA
jgi:hypothetical protein